MFVGLNRILNWLSGNGRGHDMANRNPEIVELDVTVVPPGGGYPCNVSFTLGGGKNGKVTTGNNGGKYFVKFFNKNQNPGAKDAIANGYIVLFNVIDGGTGCRFLPKPEDALWAHDIEVCPTSSCDWPEFKPIAVLNGGATLMVYNANSYIHGFAFTLRFNIPGCGLVEFDPIGSNQNGDQ